MRHSKNIQSQFIQLNIRKCKACWKCIESCPNKVFGKINMPWHKHSHIIDGNTCTGCLKCEKICEFGAIIKI